MLGKLLKYEIKATARTFLPMYALLIVFALINKFFMAVNADYLKIPQIISMSVFVVIIVGISVMTLLVTIQRFNKNLLSDEGYLSFTLPVKAHSHIDSKMIVSLMWTALSVIVSFVSIFVMAINEETIVQLRKFINEVIPELNKLGAAGYMIMFEGFIFVIIATLASIITIYAAITIGNMSSKHKLLAGIGAYIGFGVIEQIISSIILTSFGGKVEKYFESLRNYSVPEVLYAVQLILLAFIAFYIIFGVAYYFLTNWMLKKKLNLE